MEWTRDKTLQLISEYKKRRVLWDMMCEDYRKKDIKSKRLQEVCEAMGGNILPADVERKFHTLRTQYHREISRQRRKEPYDSKWFGFKALQFLSLPSACRTAKLRSKPELSEESRTTKYVIVESPVISPAASNSNLNEEQAFGGQESTRSAKELAKLVAETTKEDAIDDEKAKLSGRIITVPYGQTFNESMHVMQSHVNSQPDQTQMQSIESIPSSSLEPVNYHTADNGELQYETTRRIYKYDRAESNAAHCPTYYEEPISEHISHHAASKRLYYESPPTSAAIPKLQRNSSVSITSPKFAELASARDEFIIYGEYIANEVRTITDKEVMCTLKHKINTAIYEAHMAQLTK